MNLIVLLICVKDLVHGKNAKTQLPVLYQEFIEGKFVVKTNRGCLNTVSPGLKQEQTVHRCKKSASGIIGQTRKENFVTEWETVYHEISVINNCFNDLTQPNWGFQEGDFHHNELCGSFVSEVQDGMHCTKFHLLKNH